MPFTSTDFNPHCDMPMWMQGTPPRYWWKLLGDKGVARWYRNLQTGSPTFNELDDTIEYETNYERFSRLVTAETNSTA